MRRTLPIMSLIATCGVLLVVSGCGQPAADLQILCGGSFQPPMEKLAGMYQDETGQKVELVYGQSEDHLPRVKQHAAGDLFVSHDPYMQYTTDAGAMLRWVPVGFVAPVLVVKKGNPEGVKSIEDLAKPGLRVVLTDPKYSTCGEMVFKLLEKKGIKDEVLANVGNALVRSHGDVATQIKVGSRDAGIMWNGVAHNWLDAIEIVPTPYEYDEETRVGVMGLSYSKNKDKVEQFLKFTDEHGKDVFAEFGYVK
jgi:molybdate transport system substrate-binding protein